MNFGEKAYWFGLGVMFPFAVGGIYMFYKEMDDPEREGLLKDRAALVKVEEPNAENEGTTEDAEPEKDAPESEIAAEESENVPELTPETPEATSAEEAPEELANVKTDTDPKKEADAPAPEADGQETTESTAAAVAVADPPGAPDEPVATEEPPAAEGEKKESAPSSSSTYVAEVKETPEAAADNPSEETEQPATEDKEEAKAAEVEESKPEIDPQKSYVVKSGDNPWTIAKEFGVSMEDLLAVNDIGNAKELQIGQILKLPKAGSKPATGNAGESTAVANGSGNSDSFYWYVMKAGENPWNVSQSLGVSYTKMEKLNSDLDFRKLAPGSKLKIPK